MYAVHLSEDETSGLERDHVALYYTGPDFKFIELHASQELPYICQGMGTLLHTIMYCFAACYTTIGSHYNYLHRLTLIIARVCFILGRII